MRVADQAAHYEVGTLAVTCERNTFQSAPLRDIAHIEMGQSPDSHYVSENMDVGVPFLQGNADFGAAVPHPRFSCTVPTKLSEPGDLLISVRAPVGELNHSDRVYCIGRGLAAVRVHAIPASLAMQVVARTIPALRRVAQGTTFEAINKTDLCSITVTLPPNDERLVLAQIVDTLDTAIHQTEAIIAKLKQVKQGLLHDLLTRGIDANGELRPPQPQAPHLYKPSPLGWIPREWASPLLGELVLDHQSGVYKNRALYGGGANIIGVADLFRHETVGGQIFRRVRASPAERSRFRLSQGDLVYAESSLVLNGIARTLAVTEGGDGTLFAWHTRRLRLDRQRVNPFFLAQALNATASRRFVISRATQTALTGIPVAEYLATPVPVPSVREQERSIAKIEAIDLRVWAETLLADKLVLEKAGLMDDLLTGRVRVTPLLEAAAAP